MATHLNLLFHPLTAFFLSPSSRSLPTLPLDPTHYIGLLLLSSDTRCIYNKLDRCCSAVTSGVNYRYYLPSMSCPVVGCDFTYDLTRPNDLKTHKRVVHVATVKVVYSNPEQEIILERIAGRFQCSRCDINTTYPHVIQVRSLSI